MENRAFSLLDVKKFDDSERVFEGIASTPRPDRMGDIIDSKGAVFKLPMPLLLDHKADQQVGHVEFAKPTKEGIPFRGRIPKIEEPGPARDLVDMAWQLVKYRLRAAVSIGFRALDDGVEVLKDGGLHFTKWEWLELSLVSIPAQEDAVIFAKGLTDEAVAMLKAVDREGLAASGRRQLAIAPHSAGVTARKSTPVVKAMEAKTMAKKSIAERISAFEATRASKWARIVEIDDSAAEENRTKDAAEIEEVKGLKDEIKAIDDEIVDLRDMEKMNLVKAIEVKGDDEASASKSRAGVRVEVKGHNLPVGIFLTRIAIAKAVAHRDMRHPAEIAKERWPEMPEIETVLKTAVAAGTVASGTWAGPLAPLANAQAEFVEYLWPKTILGRIAGLTRVPFRVKVPRQTAVASVNWVGEGKPKPLGAGAFDTIEVPQYKIAGIVALTEELIRFSNPSAEMLTRNMLVNGIVKFMDNDFIDPDKAISAGVSPASITNGVTPTTASGTAYANLVTDVKAVMANFDAAEIDDSEIVVIMKTNGARALGLMQNALSQPQFPGLGAEGGTFLGMPVVTSTNIPYTEDSPQEGSPIIFVHAPSILLADDGQVTLDVSREAAVQMNDAPDDPASASTVLVSFWQHNMVGIRAERMVSWLKARSAAVQMISAAKYA